MIETIKQNQTEKQQQLLRLLNQKRLFFDGAMGTQLQQAGLKAGAIPEELNLEEPEIIIGIHQKYLEAGSDIITLNTFGCNRLKMARSQYDYRVLLHHACANAHAAQQRTGRENSSYIALDIGPLGQMLRPLGNLEFEEAYAIFSEIINEVKDEVDLVLFETETNLYELKAGILAAKENSSLPVFVSMTFEKNARTLSGNSVQTYVETVEGLGVDCLGVNCSLGPVELQSIMEEIARVAHVPLMIQPNAGLPRFSGGQTSYEMTPAYFVAALQKYAAPIAVLGGCCGTSPEFIRLLVQELQGEKIVPVSVPYRTAVTSSSDVLVFDGRVKICGERLNPTGKKKMQQALREGNFDLLVAEALRQEEAGAHILDVNVGLPGIDEVQTLQTLIPLLQEVVHIPLMIDSSSPEAIAAACRIYNGKPLINSVNGKDAVMEAIFPIAAQYQAVVIGLTLEEGIPLLAEERCTLAQKIITKAAQYGIRRENLIIDCLTLTASAQQKEVGETLKTLQIMQEKGLPTALGVSNVSFGLPNRGLLNRTFLSLALQNGLDLAIINPLDDAMTSTIDAFEVLMNLDNDSLRYIERHKNDTIAPTASGIAATSAPVAIAEGKKGLEYCIRKGLAKEAAAACQKELEQQEALSVVNDIIIPALNQVGKDYEQGHIFLPQLIQSAEAARASFVQVQQHFVRGDEPQKGPVLLCTVEGDVHDIGKNIVKVVLESYGYQVIDLGKDVKVEKVVAACQQFQPKAIGLSALMTTTVVNMRRTIEKLHESGFQIPIWVGGAVLTPEIAQEIGADYYSADAMESVKLLNQIL